MTMANTGYATRAYADSLAEWGAPRELPNAKGFLLERPIPDSDLSDAIGCYPLFDCEHWERLADDLALNAGRWVSVSLVTNPILRCSRALLESTFDRVRPYKEHFVVDLGQDPSRFVSSHHRKDARRGLRMVQVDVQERPEEWVDEWENLYANLSERHAITGLRRFSRASFAKLLALDSVVGVRARVGDETVGIQLWIGAADCVYSHLTATNSRGYSSSASYAMHWIALEYFRPRVPLLVLGAGAGTSEASQGLTEFKRGWSTGTRTAYLCGRILQEENYNRLALQSGQHESSYFPAYRAGEF